MDKQVICRKAHECNCCGLIIQPGEIANFYSGKSPKYAKDPKDKWREIQVGIEYYRGWIHLPNNQKCIDEWRRKEDEDHQRWLVEQSKKVNSNDPLADLPF